MKANLALLAGFIPAVLAVWAIGRALVHATTVPYATGPPTANEIWPAQYARGEIIREQFERMKQDIG